MTQALAPGPMSATQWVHAAWARRPSGIGITVPADELQNLLSRVYELEGLAFAAEHHMRVEVTVDGEKQP